MEQTPRETPPVVGLTRKQYYLTLLTLAVFGSLVTWLRSSPPPESSPKPDSAAAVPAVPEPATLQLDFPIMGTRGSVTLYGRDDAHEKAAGLVRAAWEEVQSRCNLFDPASELSRLNAAAAREPFRCSEELWAVLGAARKAYQLSDGAFDITAKPLMDLWGFYRKRGDTLPSAEETREAMARIGLDKVIFDDRERSVRFPVAGMSFDLGGIAKGYAVDLAAERLLAAGIRRGVIDLGGNLRVLPEPPPGKTAYRIGIRDPRDRNELLAARLELLDGAVATSGDYERFVVIGGRRYAHIMDVTTGMPVAGRRAVTVSTPKALDADILSTTLFIQGPEWGRRHRDRLPAGTEVFFYRETEVERLTVPR